MNGLQEACSKARLYEDARALCPEITISAMMKHGGHAFSDLFVMIQKGKREIGKDKTYSLPSEWWDRAPKGVAQPIIDGLESSAFELSTLHRNQFIGKSIKRIP